MFAYFVWVVMSISTFFSGSQGTDVVLLWKKIQQNLIRRRFVLYFEAFFLYISQQSFADKVGLFS